MTAELKEASIKNKAFVDQKMKEIHAELGKLKTNEEKVSYIKDRQEGCRRMLAITRQGLAGKRPGNTAIIERYVRDVNKELPALLKKYEKLVLIEIIKAHSKSDLENIRARKSNNEVNLKDKLSHKKQILLLFELGFFDLPNIKNLSTTKKGQLISHLINRDEKNTSDYIRYYNGKGAHAKHKSKTPENIKTVNHLLKSLGLKEIPQNIKDVL